MVIKHVFAGGGGGEGGGGVRVNVVESARDTDKLFVCGGKDFEKALAGRRQV